MSFQIILNNKKITLQKKENILNLIPEKDQKKYFCAKVNNRIKELTYVLTKPCNVSLLTLVDHESVSIYRNSLRYVLAMAMYQCYPNIKFTITYSISRCIFIKPISEEIITNEMFKRIKETFDKIVSKDYSIKRVSMSNNEAKKLFKQFGYEDKVELFKYRPDETATVYSCNGYWNYMNGRLVPSTGFLFSYVIRQYNPGILIQYPRTECKGEIPNFEDAPIFGKTLNESEKWAQTIDIPTVAKVNERIKKEGDADFISLCESRHARMLSDIGEYIEKKKNEIKLICVAGPSSSGKTTFANRLRIELMSRGINPIRISLDDYYLPREKCPLDEDGKVDLETIKALDIDLFNQNMLDLIDGKSVLMPSFNFQTKKREYKRTLKLKQNQPIIVEGIHALNNEMSRDIPSSQKYKIFISPASVISLDNHTPVSLTNLRLIRRIVRDYKFREASAEHTLGMWPSVRKGEFKWIYSTQESADYVFNSFLPYEPAILKKYALPLLEKIDHYSEFRTQGKTLTRMLKYYIDIDEKWVPCNSIMREFIGGSCFEENAESDEKKTK